MYKIKLQNLKNNYNIKILLHAGTPKTATTTIQHLLHNNREFLLENGYCYPFSSEKPPKHQWVVSTLIVGDMDAFISNMKISLQETIEDTHTLILSTEGIFNHWYDFPDTSKNFLKSLQEVFDVEILLVLRDQVSFTKSYYKQILKNPQVKGIDSYGKDISISQLLKDKWFLKHLNYFDFVKSCSTIFEKDNVKIFKYEKNIIQEILKYLKLDVKIENIKSENVSLSSISCELLRVINRYDLNHNDKKDILQHISNMDKILSKYAKNDVLDDVSADFIRKISSESNSKLKLGFF